MPITASTLKLVAYPPEKLVDTMVKTLAASTGTVSPTPLFIENLPEENMQVQLRDLTTVAPATTSGAVVNLNLAADTKVYPPNAINNAAIERTGLPDRNWRINASKSISLNWLNSGTGAATNFQSNWGLWAWKENLMHQALRDIFGPNYNLGLVSVPESILKALFGNPDEVWTYASTANVPAGGDTAAWIVRTQPPNGFFDVLKAIAVDATVGGTITLATAVSNDIEVHIQRDRTTGTDDLLKLPAAGMQMHPIIVDSNTDVAIDDSRIHELEPFIIARQDLQVYLTGTNAVNNVPYYASVARYREQPEHRRLWGI